MNVEIQPAGVRRAEVRTETKGTYVVVIVLASDSNEAALLWSSGNWSLEPESIDNEREEKGVYEWAP